MVGIGELVKTPQFGRYRWVFAVDGKNGIARRPAESGAGSCLVLDIRTQAENGWN
jgi:hypothetical protein